MKKYIKDKLYFILTIILSTIIIGIVYKLQNVSPLGNNSLLTVDFYHQYGPMLSELRNRILNGSSLLYSFNMGGGLPFFRNYFNYLSSPLNIIILLFKHKDLLTSYSIIIGLKAILSCVTMSYYLKNKLGKNYLFIVLSLLYGFSAYFTAYYWNIMWIDGMYMLPLITLGIDKLVNDNKPFFYIINLSYMLFANYFIGYMICIFSVFYFLITLFFINENLSFKNILKKGLIFILSSLLAGGLCSFFLIPLFKGIGEISATGDIWPSSQYYSFTIKELLINHFTGVGSTVFASGISTAPNISVGTLSIALLLLFIINPKIKFKIKIGYILLILALILAFIIPQIDFIWQAFHVPNDLPYRYSFIYSFILIIICAYSIHYIKEIKPIYIGIVYLLMLIFITLIKNSSYQNISDNMIIINYIIITVYYLCYVLFIYFGNWKKISLVFALVTVSLECILVINNNWQIDQNIESFYEDYSVYKETINMIKKDDNNFYRIDKVGILTFNDPSWYDYYGITAFSSMEYENLAVLHNKLGIPGNYINSFYYTNQSPIYNLMFDIKYVIGNVKDNTFSKRYDYDILKVSKFNYTTGLMFGVNEDVKSWKSNYDNPVNNQNNFMYKATNINNILELIKPIKETTVYENENNKIIKYTYNKSSDNYYIYYPYSNIDFIYTNNTLYYDAEDYTYYSEIKDEHFYNYEDCNERYLINENNKNTEITVYVGYNNNYESDNISVYQINENKFINAYNYLKSNELTINSFKEDYIEASSSLNEDKLIYTSIPYDEGWEVYIDDKKINTFSINNTLLAYNLPKGNHIIKLKYRIPYNKLSITISILSFITTIIWYILKKTNLKKITSKD